MRPGDAMALTMLSQRRGAGEDYLLRLATALQRGYRKTLASESGPGKAEEQPFDVWVRAAPPTEGPRAGAL